MPSPVGLRTRLARSPIRGRYNVWRCFFARSLPLGAFLDWLVSFTGSYGRAAFLRFLYVDVGEEIQGKCKTVLILDWIPLVIETDGGCFAQD